jgi:hypothetical protein
MWVAIVLVITTTLGFSTGAVIIVAVRRRQRRRGRSFKLLRQQQEADRAFFEIVGLKAQAPEWAVTDKTRSGLSSGRSRPSMNSIYTMMPTGDLAKRKQGGRTKDWTKVAKEHTGRSAMRGGNSGKKHLEELDVTSSSSE